MAIYDVNGNQISTSGGGLSFDWSNKKIVFEGDSITANNTIGYPAYVCGNLNATAENIAIVAKPIYGSYVGYNYDFRQRVSHIPYNADAIVILGDTNAIDVTSTSESNPFTTDITKWEGRWNVALSAIKKSFPTVPLFLVSVFRQVRESNSKYVAEAFRRFSQFYGCIYADMSTESPLDLQYASTVWGLYPDDSTHPSHDAMPLFADYIIQRIQQTQPHEFTGTDSISIESTKTVAVNSTADIEYTITGDLSIQWTSSNYDVACVMGGTVYGMSAGTATITAKTRNGHTATCTVTVTG